MSNPKTPISVQWSFDLLSIPKGKWINETRMQKGKSITQKVWHPDKLWVFAEGNFYNPIKQKVEFRRTIMRTYWIPDQKRWCGLVQEDSTKFLAWARYEELGKHYIAPLVPVMPEDV